MKILNDQATDICRLPLLLSLLFILANCSNIDETTITEEENANPITDSWICDIKSFEEDYWYYELQMDGNGDYLGISKTRILKVDRDGTVNSMILIDQPDEDNFSFRIHGDRIYRFHTSNEFQDYDPTIDVELQIYDFDFNLLSEHTLDTKGLIYDVEIENENLFGMLIYDVDQRQMTLKKIDLNEGIASEIILSNRGTFPRDLHILATGDYLCSDNSTGSNLILLDNDLNLKWQNSSSEYLISDVGISGQRIYIAGTKRQDNFESINVVAYLDLDGNEINSVEYELASEKWSPTMILTETKICLAQTEPESQKDMVLTIMDYDLNIENSIDIPGNYVQSPMILNENASISFIYGIAVDRDTTDFSPPSNTRLFKFDETYTVPTNIIIQ